MDECDSSDVTSPYSSDGEVITSFGKTFDSSSSSDDTGDCSQDTGAKSSIQTDSISENEREEILSIISSGLQQNNSNIFPYGAREQLTNHQPDIASRLAELSSWNKSVAVASSSLLSLIHGTDCGKPIPKTVLFDVCIFSPADPVLVLTFATACQKTQRVTEYNSELTRSIVQSVRRTTKHSFSAVFGVIEEGFCESPEDFEAKIKQLHHDASVMSISPSLVMTKTKCLDILSCFLQLLPPCPIPDLQQTSARSEDTSYSNAISQQDINAILTRIEQLEQAQADSQKEKTNLTEKYDQLLEDMEKIKQEYLTDTRVTMLMRPRALSLSDSTVSGYASSEVDVDLQQEQGGDSADIEPHPGQTEVLSRMPLHVTSDTRDLRLIQYNRNITFHEACEEGKLPVVKYILSQGLADVNCRGRFGRTPLMAAALKGRVSVFEFLISQACDLSLVDDYNDNVLHIACRGGNVNLVGKLIVNENCDVESRGESGWTPLMNAAYFAQRGVFEFLVSRGCNLKALGEDGNKVIHLACLGGDVGIVEYLISRDKVSVDCRGQNGWTPVMMASENGRRELIELLVRNGCSLTSVGEDGNTALHVACLAGDVGIVEYLISQDSVDIECRGKYEWTPVMIAAGRGHMKVVEHLVNKGCDLTVTDSDRNNILHVACLGGHVNMVEFTISQRILDIDEKGNTGRTPVMMAAQNGRRAVVDLLVGRGCSLTSLDDELNNILHIACACGDVEMVRNLLAHGIGGAKAVNHRRKTPVQLAELNGYEGVVSLFKVKK